VQGNLIYGAGCVLRGAKMLSHPRLRPFVIVPLAVNVLIFGSLIGWGFSHLVAWIEGWMAWIPGWLEFIEWIIWPLIGLAVALVTGYLFTAVALLIASPFNNLLSEKAEELITGREVAGLEGLGAALMSVPRGIFREIAKLVYYIPMALFVLILSFIPAANAAAPFLWFLLGAWMMSLQFVDYPMDNHQQSFKGGARRHRRAAPVQPRLGGVVAVCAGIPIVTSSSCPPRWSGRRFSTSRN
jgi:CysZ protein